MLSIGSKSGKTTAAALLAALAILLGYVEYLIPVVPPIAGIKLGLGNFAVLAALVLLDSNGLAAGIMLIWPIRLPWEAW